jgi:hypothetical protein
MGNQFSSGKIALSTCDVCGLTYKRKKLRALVVKTKITNTLACPECWSPDQPQLQIGMYPVNDPQALRDPRPDQSIGASGNASSRDIQWGWAPIGGAYSGIAAFTPNYLVSTTAVGTVTINAT